GLLALTWLECSCSRAIPDLRTFPTRRSSDLVERQRFVERASQQRVALSLARRFSLAAAGTKPCQCRQAQQAEGDAWNHPRRCTRSLSPKGLRARCAFPALKRTGRPWDNPRAPWRDNS